MAFFKNFFTTARGRQDVAHDSLEPQEGRVYGHGPETLPVKMNLEERMSFRRELLFESIRASLGMRSVAPHTYRIRVMRTDKRGHCFVIMLGMSPTFMATAAGQQDQLKEAAALVTKNAQTKYGLQIDGVYWRADETLDASVANWARPGHASSVAGSVPMPLDALLPSLGGQRQSNPEKYDHLGAQDMADFETAWQKDHPIHIGNRTYSSDLAPLVEATEEPAGR